MKRSSPLQRRTPLRSKPKAWTKPERAAVLVLPAIAPKPRAVMALCIGAATPQPKAPAQRDQRLREAARGEDCLIRLPGCPSDPARTIWSHYRGSAGGKGLSLKSHDLAGCFGCTFCDAVYDGQAPRPGGMTKAEVELAWHIAHIRSLGRLHQKGLL
jgi:hypothetical protein